MMTVKWNPCSNLAMDSVWVWVAFNVFVLALLALDLGVFHRTAHTVKAREAAIWSVFWIALALAFNAGIYFYSGPQAALQFLTGYLIEKALSVDNIFVFLLVFSYFRACRGNTSTGCFSGGSSAP